MKTIETTINVNPDRTATMRVPEDISPGEHKTDNFQSISVEKLHFTI